MDNKKFGVVSILVTTKTLGNFASLKFGASGDIIVVFATIAWATTAISDRYFDNVHRGLSAGEKRAEFMNDQKQYI